MGTVTIVMGDILEGGMDLTVFPCSAKGSVSSITQRWLDVYKIETPKQSGKFVEHGGLSEVYAFPGPKNKTKFYVFAASVLNKASSREVIESIGNGLGAITHTYDNIKNIETPLLGAGAGRLNPEVSGSALFQSFTAAAKPEARLFIFVNDYARQQNLERLFGELARTELVQEGHSLQLTPRQVEQFHQALLGAFTRADLEQVAYIATGQPYSTLVGQGSFSEEVWNLIMWANRHNQVRALLQQARRRNPGNIMLRSFADALA